MSHQVDGLFFESIKDEHKRIERIKGQTKLFKKLLDSSKIDDSRLILDFSLSTRSPRVEVDPVLVKELKSHQREGIKFLYNSTIENVDKLNDPGSGCILAHKSGLGKTLLTIGFIHTILCNQSTSESIKTIMIVVPVDRSKKWLQEIDKWVTQKNLTVFKTYQVGFGDTRKSSCETVRKWQESGGVLIIEDNELVKASQDPFAESLLDSLTNPGPNLVILDDRRIDFIKMVSEIRRAIFIMKTRRRIILTNVPISEADPDIFFPIVSLVKPLLFGYYGEFSKSSIISVNPLDYSRMHMGSAKLHEMVKECIQQKGMETLKRCLPAKYDYALSVRPSQLAAKMYNHYLDSSVPDVNRTQASSLFTVNHPALHQEFKSTELSNSDRYFEWVPNAFAKNIDSDVAEDLIDKNWFEAFLKPDDWKRTELSTKFVLLFKILEKCIKVGDKLIVASQTRMTLDLIEKHLKSFSHPLVSNNSKWQVNVNYFRLDDEDDYESRVNQFNDPANEDARICLMNSANFINFKLPGANRCIFFDVIFYPDVQDHFISLFHTIGQTKSVYIYRFITKDTYEDGIFQKLLTKNGNTFQLAFSRLEPHEADRMLNMKPKKSHKIPSLTAPSDGLLAEILTEENEEVLGYITLNSALQRGSSDWPKPPKGKGPPRNLSLAEAAMLRMLVDSMMGMAPY